MITEEMFRQALTDIVAGLTNPRAILPQILIVAAYFLQKFGPFPTGVSAFELDGSGIVTDCGIEFRALCDAIDCDCGDLHVVATTMDSSLSSGGLGAVIAIALARRMLTALAEKIENPDIKAAIMALLSLLG